MPNDFEQRVSGVCNPLKVSSQPVLDHAPGVGGTPLSLPTLGYGQPFLKVGIRG